MARHEFVEVDRSVCLVLRVRAIRTAVVGESGGSREPCACQEDGFVPVPVAVALAVAVTVTRITGHMSALFLSRISGCVGLGEESGQRSDGSMSGGGRGWDDQGRRERARIRDPEKRFGHAVVSMLLCMTKTMRAVVSLSLSPTVAGGGLD